MRGQHNRDGVGADDGNGSIGGRRPGGGSDNCPVMAKTLVLNDDKIRICLDFNDDDDDDRAGQEAQLSPRDRAMRLVSSNLANYHATVRKLLIQQVLTKPMV